MNAYLKLKDLNLTRPEICRIMGIAAMLFWAAVLLWFYISGRIESYIRPDYLRTSSLAAGLGLLALSVFNLRHLRSGEAACCGHDHDHDHHHEHSHDHEDNHEHEDTSFAGNGALLAVMVIPLVAAVVFSQDHYLSAATIRNKGFAEDTAAVASRVEKEIGQPDAKSAEGEFQYTLADLEKVVDRSKEGNLMLTVDQLFYTAGDAELQRVLQGQSIEAVGQVIPETGFNPGNRRLALFILMVTCCAADAQPVSIPIEFKGALPEYKEMQWVKVSGTMVYPMENGRKQAVIRVKQMEPAKEPVNDLLY